MVALRDGRLFGVAGYTGRFLFDPKTGKATEAGVIGGQSIYPMLEHQGKVYWSGYPSAQIFSYDPNRPWTLGFEGPPGSPRPPDETEPHSNPRRVHRHQFLPYEKTRVKKMLSGTVAGDGRVYFGGKGQRDYDGGGLSWYDPHSGEIGGMWEPFVNRDIGWVTTARDSRYVVIGTAPSNDPPADSKGGRTYLYDTRERKLAGFFEAIPGAWKTGPMLEVAPGRLLGETHDPATGDKTGILFGVEVPSGKVLFTKPVPATVPFNWAQGTDKWDFRLGPDGFVWTFLGNVLVRIDPRDARVYVLGKVDPAGEIVFLGRDLYLTGSTQLRRLKGIVPAP
jgi:hypothetical protein